MLNEAYVGLGSNLEDRSANISKALRLLSQISENMTVSSIYETAPQGFRSQPLFYNAVCRLWTKLDPFALLASLKDIESKLGRRRTFVNAPRTIDLDILVYGDVVLESPTLTIPHPRMAERAFVIVPLSEIAPELVHPVLKVTVRSLLKPLADDDTQQVKRLPAKTALLPESWRQ